MKIDSFDPTMSYQEYVETENRFAILSSVNKENKKDLLSRSETDAKERNENYKNIK